MNNAVGDLIIGKYSRIGIGKHSIVGAESIVIKNPPPYSVCVGNPDRIIKHYDFTLKKWMPSV